MEHYYGMEAIAKRLNLSATTVRKLYRHHGLLMYRRKKNPLQKRYRWYTNDHLIALWEVATVESHRALEKARGWKPKPRSAAVEVTENAE